MPDLAVASPAAPLTAGVRVVRCSGDLDVAAGATLIQCVDALVQKAPDVDACRVVLELTDVEFCDTGGVRAIGRARDAARHRSVAFVLRSPSAAVERILSLTRFADQFVFEPSTELRTGMGSSHKKISNP